ncbi:unnamed protein product, partial [Iphiclides podalirius]
MPIVMGKEEWSRIVSWTDAGRENAESLRKKEYIQYLHDTSRAMTKSWPNSLEIISTQNRLEENITKRFDDLQAQISNAGSSKDTVARIAEELRSFREIVSGILGLLRQQIKECVRQVDEIDTRSRRKALIISGMPEKDNEDCTQRVLEVFNNNLGLSDISKSYIKSCHRLAERVFTLVCGMFGPRVVFIVVRTSDATIHKLTSEEELVVLTTKYPKASGKPSK